MHRLVVSLATAFALTLTACGSPGVAATRSTPDGTVQWFKAQASNKNYANEWDALSPGLKRRLSQSAGRNVDLGDYIFMRNKLQENPQVRFAEQFIDFASISSPRMNGPNQARVTVGAFGNNTDLGLVRLQRWELWINGENQPYTGTLGDPAIRAEEQPDGTVVVVQQGLEPLVFEKRQVGRYQVIDQWYIDDLGNMEQQFLR
ncbi:MAG: hypothetical protein AB7T63_12180 [Planctomycetota bacterium]